MLYSVFKGAPEQIGYAYGQKFSDLIRQNTAILVKRTGFEPLPESNPEFCAWITGQEDIISKYWPWLITEIKAAAEGSGQSFRDILFLNLRAWQYSLYGAPQQLCSSMVITLAGGSIANAGALDDDRRYYQGLVHIVPDTGYAFLTFPIGGTCWGNRGINSAGLCIGESSQIIQGLNKFPETICADIAVRIILQTCRTVREVREFCTRHPFTLNLVCCDAEGGVFCAHATSAGLFEISDSAPCALTNHVSDDSIMQSLNSRGAQSFPESPTTRLRRGRLLSFCKSMNGSAGSDEIKKFIADRLSGRRDSTCPPGNIVLTYANSQNEKGKLWVAEPQITGHEEWEVFSL